MGTIPIVTRSRQKQSNAALRNDAKLQYKDEKETEETEIEMKRDDLVHFLNQKEKAKNTSKYTVRLSKMSKKARMKKY